uniref:Uncharacterized protein n=1 Tax=Physcomitrium patens TaxID=3218 RepID=A0A2K1LAX6_PHYPA|nr:hypothetical protein PHYPA_001604 [Physcomitrium patens]
MHRNAVYGHDEWAKHKSCWRHGRHLKTIFASRPIVATGPPVAFCTLIAVFVVIFNHSVLVGHFPVWVPVIQVASIPFALTSSVLSLLLVFRTNSSYNRFDEARKAWGSNVNRTRDLARQALTWIRSPADLPKLHCLLRHIKAYSYCLKDHLTQDNTLREELAKVLEPTELELVLSSKHRPNYVMQVMSELIKQCKVSEWESMSMDRNLTQFHDNVGACERLFKTPIPVAYTRLTSRVLSLWHISLPFALWNSCHWLTIPATFFSSAALFYIEEVGVLIEEPFWILALMSISDGICSALDGLVAAHQETRLVWGVHPQAVCKKDHVVITFENSRSCASDGFRPQHDYIDVAMTRVNSVS